MRNDCISIQLKLIWLAFTWWKSTICLNLCFSFQDAISRIMNIFKMERSHCLFRFHRYGCDVKKNIHFQNVSWVKMKHHTKRRSHRWSLPTWRYLLLRKSIHGKRSPSTVGNDVKQFTRIGARPIASMIPSVLRWRTHDDHKSATLMIRRRIKYYLNDRWPPQKQNSSTKRRSFSRANTPTW